MTVRRGKSKKAAPAVREKLRGAFTVGVTLTRSAAHRSERRGWWTVRYGEERCTAQCPSSVADQQARGVQGLCAAPTPRGQQWSEGARCGELGEASNTTPPHARSSRDGHGWVTRARRAARYSKCRVGGSSAAERRTFAQIHCTFARRRRPSGRMWSAGHGSLLSRWCRGQACANGDNEDNDNDACAKWTAKKTDSAKCQMQKPYAKSQACK